MDTLPSFEEIERRCNDNYSAIFMFAQDFRHILDNPRYFQSYEKINQQDVTFICNTLHSADFSKINQEDRNQIIAFRKTLNRFKREASAEEIARFIMRVDKFTFALPTCPTDMFHHIIGQLRMLKMSDFPASIETKNVCKELLEKLSSFNEEDVFVRAGSIKILLPHSCYLEEILKLPKRNIRKTDKDLKRVVSMMLLRVNQYPKIDTKVPKPSFRDIIKKLLHIP